MTGNDHVKMSTSIIDYIFRELAITYLGRMDLAHESGPGKEIEPEYDSEEVVDEREVSVAQLTLPSRAFTEPLANGALRGACAGDRAGR